ncbi:g8534 [Coccomyxa viridis]|uniref:G8534 protein n=1 Tax=Coccomyxa viridis TaxID=1274662 RepID=A0ABP1G1M7_9CHLO
MEETVGIVPVVKGSGAFKVTLHQRHDAASVLQYLETILGGGELEDPEGYIFLSDSDEKLKEGEGYTFTPDNILHGVEIGPQHYVGVEDEGLRDRTYCAERGQTVDTTLRLAMRFGAVILQGPPKAGKTSLLQLLYAGAPKSGSSSKVLYVNLAQAQGDIDRALEQHQTSWQKLFATKEKGSRDLDLLLVDEAQLISATDVRVWRGIRALHHGQPPRRVRPLRVIMASTYACRPGGSPLDLGEGCTITLEYSQRLNAGLQFLLPEYEALLESFRSLKWKDALFDNDLRRSIYHLTAGQAGLITELLDNAASKLALKLFTRGDFDKMLRLCLESGQAFRDELSHIQIFLEHTSQFQAAKDVLNTLLDDKCTPEGISKTKAGELWEAARSLCSEGFLIQRKVDGVNHIGFISPLHRIACTQQHLQG